MTLKRVLSAITACALALTCTGCTPIQAILDQTVGDGYIADIESIPHIGFSNGEVTETDYILTVEEFGALDTVYDDYRGNGFYSCLTEANEKTIYHAYEYALENGYQNILFDASLVNNAEQLQELLTFLSLDSPLLEQNLSYEIGTFTTYYPVEIYDFYTKNACFEGFYITVKNFDNILWEKKLEAIDKARAVLNSLQFSEDTSDGEKAAAIYRYIGQTVSYEEYDYPQQGDVYPYLYDTLVRGRSHCDGFANALSLLLNMADVYCVEKQCIKVDNEDIGHTWNYACLDGNWYNIDGTYVDWIPKIECGMLGPGFAFSDELQQGTPDYADYYTESIDNYSLKPDTYVSTVNDADFVECVCAAYTSHNMDWAYVIVDSYDKDALSLQMQQVANQLRTRVYYGSFPIKNQRTAVLIHSGELYNK